MKNSPSTKPTSTPGHATSHRAAPPSWLPSPTPTPSNNCGRNSANPADKPCATSPPRDRLTNAQLDALPLQQLRNLHSKVKADADAAQRKTARLQRTQIRIKRAITRKAKDQSCAE